MNPMTLFDLVPAFISTASLMERIPSEKRENGWSTTVQLIPLSPYENSSGAKRSAARWRFLRILRCRNYS